MFSQYQNTYHYRISYRESKYSKSLLKFLYIYIFKNMLSWKILGYQDRTILISARELVLDQTRTPNIPIISYTRVYEINKNHITYIEKDTTAVNRYKILVFRFIKPETFMAVKPLYLCDYQNQYTQVPVVDT